MQHKPLSSPDALPALSTTPSPSLKNRGCSLHLCIFILWLNQFSCEDQDPLKSRIRLGRVWCRGVILSGVGWCAPRLSPRVWHNWFSVLRKDIRLMARPLAALNVLRATSDEQELSIRFEAEMQSPASFISATYSINMQFNCTQGAICVWGIARSNHVSICGYSHIMFNLFALLLSS